MEWTVVGAVREIGARRRGQNIAASAYVNRDYLSGITGMEGTTADIRIKTDQHSDAALRIVSSKLEQQFDNAGLHRISVNPSTERMQELKDHLVVIQMFLLLMAALVAAVGGLALASTMSINVMERTREFGIMRAIGASTDDVLQIVVIEGVVIGIGLACCHRACVATWCDHRGLCREYIYPGTAGACLFLPGDGRMVFIGDPYWNYCKCIPGMAGSTIAGSAGSGLWVKMKGGDTTWNILAWNGS